MNNYNKYLKYKSKYLKLKTYLKQSGGSSGSIIVQDKNDENDENYYVGHDLEDDMENDKLTIYLFKASWCGHCKNFRSTWNSVANHFSGNVNFITYDSDTNTKPVKEWKISGFPTIIMRNGQSAREYNGDRDLDSLINYIKSII